MSIGPTGQTRLILMDCVSLPSRLGRYFSAGTRQRRQRLSRHIRRLGTVLLAGGFAVAPPLLDIVSHPAAATETIFAQEYSTHPPKRVRIRALGFSGIWTKTVSVRGTLANETTEREFAVFRYLGLQDKYQPQDWIVIENVTRLYLVMDVPGAGAMRLPTRLRSDESEFSHFLFRKRDGGWVQQPANQPLDFLEDPDCILADYSWEDGGGFLHQDFFFQIQIGSDCVA